MKGSRKSSAGSCMESEAAAARRLFSWYHAPLSFRLVCPLTRRLRGTRPSKGRGRRYRRQAERGWATRHPHTGSIGNHHRDKGTRLGAERSRRTIEGSCGLDRAQHDGKQPRNSLLSTFVPPRGANNLLRVALATSGRTIGQCRFCFWDESLLLPVVTSFAVTSGAPANSPSTAAQSEA